MTAEPEGVNLNTPDLAAEKLAGLQELFPGVISDGVLDAARLGELANLNVAGLKDGRERYGLTWAGKHEAVQSLLKPSRGSLAPDIENSVDFDTAENVFIEGDNLEVLKLLQKAYNDQVKLIYIDPPYNTGKDFVYNDDFSDGLRGYLEYTGQLNGEGNLAAANADLAGRRHSRWLSMMFTRLVLARNLLSQDGVIFVSIDDNEVHNMRSMMSEIFGEENFLGCITIVSNLKGRSDDRFFATAHNYLLAFQRNDFLPLGVRLPDEYIKDYPERDDQGRAYRLQGLRKRGSNAKRTDRPSMYYPFYVNPQTGHVSLSPKTNGTAEALPVLSDGSDGRWRWGRSTAEGRLEELMGRQVGPERRWDIFQIDRLDRDGSEKRVVPKTVWQGPEFANETGTLQVKGLLGAPVFDNPKPTGLMRQLLEYSVGPTDLILDFFAGSGTMAQAVLEANAQDNGRRRYICVNLPEPTPVGSVARESGYATVSDITWTRIRAAMDAIEGAERQGLRTFSLSQSNFQGPRTEPAQGDLLQLNVSTLVDGEFDLYMVALEVLLKEGIRLDVPWVWTTVGDADVVSADGVAVVLSTALTDGVVKAMVETRQRVLVFLEDGFDGSDSVKANAFFACQQAGITMKTV